MPAHRLWMKSGASGRAVYFNHAPVHHQHDTDRQRFHGKPYKEGLKP